MVSVKTGEKKTENKLPMYLSRINLTSHYQIDYTDHQWTIRAIHIVKLFINLI